MSDNTAKVIKYECMYTSDTKKGESECVFAGLLLVHLDVVPQPKFGTMFLAHQDFVSQNVSEIFKQTQTARKAASKDAQAWALSVDAKEPSGSRNMFGGTPSFIATPLRSQQEPSTLLSTSKSLYKGFNVPPPRSYTDKNTTKPSLTKSNPTSKSSWTGSTPSKFSNTTPRPPSRTLPLTAHNAATSTPRAKPYDRPATSTSQSSKSSFPASPYVITNSPSVASPFRPPSFIRPSPGGSGVGTPGRPSSAMSRLEEFKFRES
ncbi:hypothetical protein P7C70_g1242, partial [Phenoliferia sp. Uapishka_3]